jgi:nicotinate-nucleotide pyrophosphorylase (carboxylating)
MKIVSGGWKKVSHQIKDEIREAVMIGGAGVRITDEPFVYLDKNYVRMLGGISPALRSVVRFNDRAKVVQIRGETGAISIEAILSVGCGADIVMVDTGNISDLQLVSEALRGQGLRGNVKIAFGGSIQIEDIPRFLDMDVDILDIGRAIIDAPMLDIRLDVEVAKR